jgi:ssDNA-binding Zn-finger/Zn-ribbon topoisomerase 1
MRRLVPVGECLEWDGSRSDWGYGIILTERVDGVRKSRMTHKVVFEHHHGDVPRGMIVRHTCDNPPCCRIDHLLVGTHADNTRDMDERGRRNINTPNLNRERCRRGHDLTLPKNRYLEKGHKGQLKLRCAECHRQRLRIPGAVENGAKTHCPAGHEYTPENTYIRADRPTGGRGCRVCRAESVARVKRARRHHAVDVC